jgi:hypothetical protein
MVRKIAYALLAAAIGFVVIWVQYTGTKRILGVTTVFLYESLYTGLVLVMGVPVLLRFRHKRYFAVRTVTVMLVQLFFGYLLGYFLLPSSWRGTMEYGSTVFGPFLQYFWPLEINGVVVHKYLGLTPVVVGWLIYTIGTSLVIMPLIVMRFGRAYCSWFCGCGL